MTAAALPAAAGRSFLPAGTAPLLRAYLRRDRRRLTVWVLALALTTVYATVALGSVYRTQAERQARAAVIDTPAGVLLSGPGYGTEHYTLGAMIANELGFSVMIAIAIMSILLVARHTRAGEEDGDAELLLAGAVSRRAPLTAALLLVGLANLAIAVVVTAGLAGSGLAVADSVALAVGWALTGCAFGVLAAVSAQLFEQARGASGAAMGLLGLAAVVRGVGDIRRTHGSALSWFSPIDWPQQTRAFVELRWAPLLLPVALIAVLVPAAYALTDRRDVGAGLLAARGGPPAASRRLSGPVALFARLQRGTVIGWAAAMLLLGATFGSLTRSVTDMLASNPVLASAFERGGAGVTDSFAAATAQYLALVVGGFAVASVLRVRAEETAGRTEAMLATALDRRRLLGAAVVVAAAGALLLLLVTGLGQGLAAAQASGAPAAIGRNLAAVLVHFPAVLVVLAVPALLVGIAPRLAPLAWLVVVWSLLSGMFGALLHLPRWALDLSPFGWDPAVPAVRLDVVPLVVLTLVAAALVAVGLAGFRRRDVPA